jgi:hypothetical protein
MPINIEQCENEHIVCAVVTDPMLISDLTDLNQDFRKLCQASTTVIHILIDMRHSRDIPAGALLMCRDVYFKNLPQNCGYVVAIGASTLAQMMSRIVTRLTGFDRFRYFDSAETAWHFLRIRIGDEAADAV